MTVAPVRRLAALVALVLLAVTACGAGSTNSSGESGGGSSSDGGTVTAGLVAEPASLDFTTVDGAAIPQVLLDNVYETLVKVDDTGKIVPALATSYDVSDDGLTYTFQLTPDATFTDGAKFTAADAVYSIEQVKTKWTTSLAAAMKVVKSAEAVSDTELKVTLSTPSNDWLYRMTTRIGAMFSKDATNNKASSAIGTGPYQLTKWNKGDSIIMTRNDKYWGDKPFYKTVNLKFFTDPTALNNALLAGSINIVTTVQAPESLDQFTSGANADKFQVIEGTTNGEVVLSMNENNKYLGDVRVRQAIRYAIDHKTLVDNCWAGKGELIGTMTPPTDPWYEDRTGDFPYDPTKAKELLQEAGAQAITLRLRVPSLPYATACGPEVKSQLAKVGITVQLDTLEFPAAWLKTVFTNKDFDMSIVAHVEPRDTPAVFGNPDYYTTFKNSQIAGLLTKADEGSAEDQITYMKQAEELISKQAAADFLFLLPNLVVADKDITGLPKNAIGESFRLADLKAA